MDEKDRALFRAVAAGNPASGGTTVHRHRLIVQTAMEMAGELYDLVMRDNEAYATWHRLCPELTPAILHERFVVLMTPRLLDAARATLAGMLARPGDERLQSFIHDALLADATLRRGNRAARRAAAAQQRQMGSTK